MVEPRVDGYWIKPFTKFKLEILRAEGERSEFSASIADSADTPDENDDFGILVDLHLDMREYPAALLLARLDAIRAVLAGWIDLADDPTTAPIAKRLSEQIEQILGGDRHA